MNYKQFVPSIMGLASFIISLILFGLVFWWFTNVNAYKKTVSTVNISRGANYAWSYASSYEGVKNNTIEYTCPAGMTICVDYAIQGCSNPGNITDSSTGITYTNQENPIMDIMNVKSDYWGKICSGPNNLSQTGTNTSVPNINNNYFVAQDISNDVINGKGNCNGQNTCKFQYNNISFPILCDTDFEITTDTKNLYTQIISGYTCVPYGSVCPPPNVNLCLSNHNPKQPPSS